MSLHSIGLALRAMSINDLPAFLELRSTFALPTGRSIQRVQVNRAQHESLYRAGIDADPALAVQRAFSAIQRSRGAPGWDVFVPRFLVCVGIGALASGMINGGRRPATRSSMICNCRGRQMFFRS